MSSLQYYAYAGEGEKLGNAYHYSQAVRIGDRIECSGQGGWDPKTGEISKDVNEEMDQTFANIDLNLRSAGGKGFSQVFRMNTYHAPLTEESVEALLRNLKKWFPDHKPVLTALGIEKLALEDMRIEIEVVAVDP